MSNMTGKGGRHSMIQLGAKAGRWADRDPHLCITGKPVGASTEAGGWGRLSWDQDSVVWLGVRVQSRVGVSPALLKGDWLHLDQRPHTGWAPHQEAECTSMASGAHWHCCPIPVPSASEPGQHRTQGIRVQSLVLSSRRTQGWGGSVLSETPSGLQVPQGSWRVPPRRRKRGGGQE